jgi:hypothetical protein
MHVDGNFPAPLQVLAFLGSATLAGVLVLVSLYGFARKKAWAKKALGTLAGGVGLYFLLMAGFSMFSHEQTLPRGQEKYFCEIDCHLAYSVADVEWVGNGPTRALAVTVRTRFDESTISAHRPKDAPLMPNPRKVVLVDGAAHSYAHSGVEGTPLTKELIPGQSYTTTLTFPVTHADSSLRLLITSTDGPMMLLIGNEMSWGHKKTYLAF